MLDSSPATLRKTNRLLLAGAIALICLATVLVVWLLKQSYQRYQEAAANTVHSTAHNLSISLGAHFLESELALQSAVAEYRRLQSSGEFTTQHFSDYVRSLKQRLPHALSVRGTDSKGNIIYGLSADNANHVNIGSERHFIQLREQRQLVISAPMKSRVSGEWLFSLMLPLVGPDGEFAGSVYVNTATQQVDDLFDATKLGGNSLLLLFTEDRYVISRKPLLSEETDAPVQLAASVVSHLLAAGQGRRTFVSVSPIDGQHRTSGYHKIGDYPAYVLVALTENDYLAQWKHERLFGGIFIALLALGSLILGLSLRSYVSARLRVEVLEASQASHDDLAAIIRAIPDVLFEVDLAGRYIDYRVNNVDELHQPEGGLIGKQLSDILPPEAAAATMQAIEEANEHGSSYGTQICIRTASGELWFELSISRKQGAVGKAPTFIVLSRDITERNQAQQKIEQLAFSDILTGLPNRRLFLDRLRQGMALSERNSHYCALLFIDLDKFKTLNDTFGHQIGDILLIKIAERLRRAVREHDTVARLGGDEFVILLAQLGMQEEEARQQAAQIATKVLEQLAREYDLDGHMYLGSSSIGIAVFCGQALGSEELLRRADLAMYQAKSEGHNTLCFFEPEMHAGIVARQELEIDLKQAIIHEEFSLSFQSQVDQHGHLIGAEALIRWHSPQRGQVAPSDFIPLAEETGLILPIGHWVLREACRYLEHWNTQPGLANLTVSVNVSARQVALPTFVEEVSELLSFYEVAPQRLKLEITESMLVDHIDEIIIKLDALRNMGVRLSLDDFGTGYSSLNYLKQLPFNQVKIDQSFAHDVLDDGNSAAICRAIIALGHALGLEVLAEGIETEAQWAFFKREGCRYGQGYYFSKPLPALEFEARYGGAEQAPPA